jgi:hypothetical protein
VRRLFGLTLALVVAAAAHADTRIKVKVTQAGRGKAAAGVALVDASTTQVVAGATLRPPFRTRLRADAGTYYLDGDVVRFDGAAGAVSALFAVGDEKKLRVPLSIAPHASALRAAGARRGLGGGGPPVATMGPVLLVEPDGTVDVEGAFLTVLFNRTKDICGLVWVDSSERVLAARQRDLDLQSRGLLSPLTPIRDQRILPTMRVEGLFQDDGTNVSGELRLVDIASGQVIATRQFEGRRRGFYSSYVDWATEFADELCDPQVTTTTAATSTTFASSTTIPGGCTTDEDCGPCSCCNPTVGVCGAVLGGTVHCCAITPPYPLGDICGPKQPATCPTDTTCNSPTQPGYYYNCQGCPSGNILEWYAPSGSFDRSNCVRR